MLDDLYSLLYASDKGERPSATVSDEVLMSNVNHASVDAYLLNSFGQNRPSVAERYVGLPELSIPSLPDIKCSGRQPPNSAETFGDNMDPQLCPTLLDTLHCLNERPGMLDPPLWLQNPNLENEPKSASPHLQSVSAALYKPPITLESPRGLENRLPAGRTAVERNFDSFGVGECRFAPNAGSLPVEPSKSSKNKASLDSCKERSKECRSEGQTCAVAVQTSPSILEGLLNEQQAGTSAKRKRKNIRQRAMPLDSVAYFSDQLEALEGAAANLRNSVELLRSGKRLTHPLVERLC